MGEFALDYLDLGIPIFITCSPGDGQCLEGHRNQRTGLIEHCPPDKMGKKPLVRWERYQDVLAPRDIARGWWRKWPSGNIAMPTGRLSGCCVVDIDGPEAMKLATALGYPSGPSVQTGKIGGRHLYFAWRSDAPTLYAKADGIDFRGHGGYVMLPPSRHALGPRYKWAAEWGIDLDDLPELPYWVDERARHTRQWASGAEGDVYAEGERNARLASLAGRWRKQGMSPLELYAALSVANQSRCRPPLDDDEVRQIAESVGRYEPNPDEDLSGHVGKSKNRDSDIPGGVGNPGTSNFETEGPRYWRASELGDRKAEETAWFCRGLVGPGLLTELDGYAKLAGKTTFALALVRAILLGEEFLDFDVTPTSVVYLIEQTWQSLIPNLRKAGLLESEDLHLRFYNESRGVPWPRVVKQSIEYAQQVGAGLLVVDTMAQWSGIRGDQENDSGRAYQMVEPLQGAAAEGLGVLIVRHDRKSGGEVGISARGSSAYAAIMDVILHLTPMQGEKVNARQRVLEGAGRFGDDTPQVMVVELSQEEPFTYSSQGTPATVVEMIDEISILAVLSTKETEAKTQEEVVQDAGVRRQSVGRLLRKMVKDGRVIQVWDGKRGHPKAYYQKPPIDD